MKPQKGGSDYAGPCSHCEDLDYYSERIVSLEDFVWESNRSEFFSSVVGLIFLQKSDLPVVVPFLLKRSNCVLVA